MSNITLDMIYQDFMTAIDTVPHECFLHKISKQKIKDQLFVELNHFQQKTAILMVVYLIQFLVQVA